VPREWLGEQFIIEAEHLKETKPDSYNHEYMGEVTGTGGEVFTNVTIRKITDEEIRSFEVVKRGMDFGYAVDPFCYNVMAYDRKRKRLYIYHELYKVGLSNHSAIEQVKLENKNNEMIYADSAEPKSIHEFNQSGLRTIGCKKGPDSVEYGIKFLQDLEEIVIDDIRCPETAREFLSYELEKDSQGNFKAGYPDKNNHAIDSVRYGMNLECMQFKDEKKKKRNDGELTPQEKHEKAVKTITGGTVDKKMFKWG
jgi:phage terminase large subunit